MQALTVYSNKYLSINLNVYLHTRHFFIKPKYMLQGDMIIQEKREEPLLSCCIQGFFSSNHFSWVMTLSKLSDKTHLRQKFVEAIPDKRV